MVVVLLHGAAGGWDELAIAVVALAVLWVAVKLAGRKPATDHDDDAVESGETATAEVQQEQPDAKRPTVSKLS
jgi:hypothetical protein